MKFSIKLILVIGFALLSVHTNAQTKEEKKLAKIKKANDALIIENKAPLLDGKQQTKAFFATSDNTTTTADLCTEFTFGDGVDLYFNAVYGDELQNYFVNLASEAGIKYKSYSKYSDGTTKVRTFEDMHEKYEILVDGVSVYEGGYDFSHVYSRLFITQPKNYIDNNSYVLKWFLKNQNLFMKDCEIQILHTFYLKEPHFYSEEERLFFKDKCKITFKSNILNYKYDEEKATKFFLQYMAYYYEYYDMEEENQEIVDKAFDFYKKKNRIKDENIEIESIVMSQWQKVHFENIDALKGRRAWAIIFFKDKDTGKYRCLAFNMYQEHLYENNYEEVEISRANEEFKLGLTFLNQYKKQIGTYLKSHSLDSAL